MKLTVLIDNNSHAGSCLISEHGLSFLIKEEKVNLLFDCGSTDAFIKNAYDMQIDLAKVTDIILSHGHSDHIGGFMRLQALYQQFRKSGITFDSKKLIDDIKSDSPNLKENLSRVNEAKNNNLKNSEYG